MGFEGASYHNYFPAPHSRLAPKYAITSADFYEEDKTASLVALVQRLCLFHGPQVCPLMGHSLIVELSLLSLCHLRLCIVFLPICRFCAS